MKTILVPLDGSPLADRVLPYVQVLAAVFRARVHLIRAISATEHDRLLMRSALAEARAGSIVPIGAQVPSTATKQALESIRVYPGRDASFTLYDDDGVTNAYRKGGGVSATLRWDDRAGRLTASGRLPTGQDAAALVKVVGS